MIRSQKQTLAVIGLILIWWVLAVQAIQAAPPSESLLQEAGHTPADLIAAVNALRLSNGLSALSPHPSLMQVAQWEVNAIAAGAPGHTRPPGLTLGAWMISLGYPLGGNIALDGYRSENWIAGTELSVDEAIQLWLGDAPHTNTMLSPQRSDIGAGVAIGEDPWGKTVYYYVIETALQTTSGQQQPEALALLTSLPQTQSATYGDATQAAAAALVPQYMIPVSLATARPDGDVIHEVKYGQSLWSIAIAYGVRIDQIKLLNNLTSNQVWTDQQLLVQKGATQPAPTATGVPSQTPGEAPTLTATSRLEIRTPKPSPNNASSTAGSPALVMFLVVAAAFAGLLGLLFYYDFKH